MTRRAPPTPDAALGLVAAGPTPAESGAGLRTALTRPVEARADPADPYTMLATVPAAFTRLPDRDRLLATAQIVWTLTEDPTVLRVGILLDGRRIAVPTSDGLRTSPVRRTDFRTVAPR